jgi:hypothetical protein
VKLPRNRRQRNKILKPTATAASKRFVNMTTLECREMEVLGNGWERLWFDCPRCNSEGILVVEAHITNGVSDDMVAITKECPVCHLEVDAVTDEV